jgi:N6-adenosine-specific RNA methylase IME4
LRVRGDIEVELPKLAGAGYEVVYADPNWQYYGDPNKDQAAGKHYAGMPYEAISALPVREIMAKRAALFCWVTSPLAFYQMVAISKWGLHYRGVTYVWPKTRKDGGLIAGQGVRPTFTKPTTEYLTAWTTNARGRPFRIYTERQAQVHPLPRPKRHSEKPAEFRDLLVELCGERKRIELWARVGVDGWDSIGDELEAA